MSGGSVDDGKGLLWKLPVVKTKDLGKLGPGIGFGVGCGIGLGAGLFGGAGIGPGFPGFQFGVGVGAGCGFGLGFGYGMGKGVAYDENRRYSNVGKLFLFQRNRKQQRPSENQIDALVDDLITSTKKLIEATSKEFDKWR